MATDEDPGDPDVDSSVGSPDLFSPDGQKLVIYTHSDLRWTREEEAAAAVHAALALFGLDVRPVVVLSASPTKMAERSRATYVDAAHGGKVTAGAAIVDRKERG